MVVANAAHRTTLTNGIFQYYAETALPTNGAWKSYKNALGLATAWTPTTLPLENVPSSTANSPLCHSSLVQWTMTTNAANGGPLQKDRCGKACFDIARKLAEMLNAYFVALAATPTYSPGGGPARSGRRRLRHLPRDLHGRQDGLRLVPRQHPDRRPHGLSVHANGSTRTGARDPGTYLEECTVRKTHVLVLAVVAIVIVLAIGAVSAYGSLASDVTAPTTTTDVAASYWDSADHHRHGD